MPSVILAAGRGERLNGYAAPFMKPTLLVNGVPIIVQQLRNAELVDHNITIVVAPENARAIIELARHANVDSWESLQFTIQPDPVSVVDALKRGIMTQADEPLCVLMGDNIVPRAAMMGVLSLCDDIRADLVVATRRMKLEDAWRRFTYHTADHWWEKEYPATVDMSESPDEVDVWVGPVIIRSPHEFYAGLGSNESIGTTFNVYHSSTVCYTCECTDIGVPEALT